MIQPIGPFECSVCGTEGRIYHIAHVTHLDPNGVEIFLTVFGCPSCYEEMKAIMDTFQETGESAMPERPACYGSEEDPYQCGPCPHMAECHQEAERLYRAGERR